MKTTVKGDQERILMDWVIRDEDTDEIIGIDPKAPKKVKAYYKLFVERQNSTEPIIKE